MKILVTRPRLEAGGATQSILRLGQGLSQAGHQFIIATHSGDWVEAARRLDFKLYFLPLYPTSVLNLVGATVPLLKIVRREKIDLIHSHHRFANLACQFVSHLSGVPVVSTVHEFKGDQRWLTRWGLNQQVITFSQAVKTHLVMHYGIPDHRITVVKMGVSPAPPAPRAVALTRERLKMRPDRLAIGCISRLSAEKGIDILLEALALVNKEGKHPFDCWVIGDGPLRTQLEALSSHLAINNRVHFVGWQDEISSLVTNLDFLVLPSLVEGLGLVILEGLAQAKPTIGSRIGGIPEIIKDHHNGLLVTPGNAVELARAIIYLLDNPGLIRQLGQAGRRDLADQFSFEVMIEQTEQVYQAALNVMH